MPPNPSKSSRSSGSRSSTARSSSTSSAAKPAPKASAGKSPAKSAAAKSAPKTPAAKPTPTSSAAKPAPKSTAAKPAPKTTKPAGATTRATSSSSAATKTTKTTKPPKTYKGQPGELEGNRPGLALIVGRGIVKEDFYARLRGGTTSMKAATRGDVGLELSKEDIEVLKTLDWDSIDPHVEELRALLPKLKVRKDAASW